VGRDALMRVVRHLDPRLREDDEIDRVSPLEYSVFVSFVLFVVIF
jgi:hypothetical protein